MYDFSIGYWNGFIRVIFLGFHLIEVYLERTFELLYLMKIILQMSKYLITNSQELAQKIYNVSIIYK